MVLYTKKLTNFFTQFMMGRMYSALQDGKPELIPEGSDTHYFHCIDYVRQSVMCAGDVALEPHTENDGPDNGPLDGGWNGSKSLTRDTTTGKILTLNSTCLQKLRRSDQLLGTYVLALAQRISLCKTCSHCANFEQAKSLTVPEWSFLSTTEPRHLGS